MAIEYTLITSDQQDANLIVCIPRIAQFAYSRAKLGITVRVRFPNALFTTCYLADTLICEKPARKSENFDRVINLDDAIPDNPCNSDMLTAMSPLFSRRHTPVLLDPKFCFDWMKTATRARGKKVMIVACHGCCGDSVLHTRFNSLLDNIRNYTDLPVYVDSWNFVDSVILASDLNSVKTFASLVSLAFFYVGPHCVHSQIAALMGVPTFILQENVNDNRIRVRDTVKAFKSAEDATDERHGSSLISRAYKFWNSADRSCG